VGRLRGVWAPRGPEPVVGFRTGTGEDKTRRRRDHPYIEPRPTPWVPESGWPFSLSPESGWPFSLSLAGSMSRWPVWAAARERASDTTGCSRLARGSPLPGRPCLQVPLDCGQGGRAGSWCLGPRSVCTRPGMVGFPVLCGPPGRSEERNGCQGGSACRWPQVFHTQAIRLRPMTLFNPVFNCVTP
jgi:hypothetical protein